MTPQGAPAGALVRGDFLSRLLHHDDLSWGMIVIALLAAFGLGAAHALTPGHGKTIVAAYLVGSRGTVKHAVFLGAIVTFTHTVSVFVLGIATLFLFRYVMPEKITQALGVISGLSIVAVGAWMLWKRLRGAAHGRHHHHHHDHDGDHHHDHDHHHAGHHHDHAHRHHDHAHGHHHVPELSWAGLVALGASGGLVPCESALILLLSAIALNRVGLGLLLLVSFSLGLAVLLTAIGMLVLFARHLIPERKGHVAGLFRWMPVVSGAVVVCAGMVMTAVSLGWIAPKWMIG
jgi:ABC-type nickel/cobalt efflux system permease component RcnA